jgi:hypothetical protein
MMEAVADLLERAGVGTSPGTAPGDPDLLIDFDGRDAAATGVPRIRAACHGPTATVLTLVGRPCAACAPADAISGHRGDDDPLAGAAAASGAALVAAETLRVLLERPATGRRQRIDLRLGTFASESLETSGCGRCREAYR